MTFVNIILFMILLFGVFLISLNKNENTLLSRLPSYKKNIKTKYYDDFVFLIKRKLCENSYDDELYKVLSYIKNISILGRSKNISTEYLLEELSDVSKMLRPCFLKMAEHVNVNDIEGAETILGDLIGSDIARDIGHFLAGWERLNPDDILKTIETYQEILSESRKTRIEKRDETISDIIYFPVVLNCMLVLLNFVYIAYFLEQQNSFDLFLY